jgi:hypothetical protein
MVVEATSEQGAQVAYTVRAQDDIDGTATLEEDGSTVTQDDVGGDITTSCSPASGSTFPIGDTEVKCSATDGAGNEGSTSITLTVNAPPSSSSSSPPPPRQIQTILTLDTIENVPWGKDVTVRGKLADASKGGEGIGGRIITFDGTGAFNLPDDGVVTNTDGTFTARGASPITIATGWTVQAHFSGDSTYITSDNVKEYLASDSTIRTYSPAATLG